jgi:mannose/cellobiose epimerase-like protein (N-acyl-D-glucosamine 2-epimerase family)
MTPFPDQPRPDAAVGSKYVVCKSAFAVSVGTVVELYKNDGSAMPMFKTPGHLWFEWCRLAPLRNEDR